MMLKNLKRLQQELKINNVKKNTQGHTVHWVSEQGYSSTDVVFWLQYQKQQPDKIFYRTDYDETKPFEEILVSQKIRSNTLPELHLPYQGKLPVSKLRLDDLLKLYEESGVPLRYHKFYKGLNGDANAVHEYDSFTESDSEGDE